MKKFLSPMMVVTLLFGFFIANTQAASAPAGVKKSAPTSATTNVPEWQKKWDETLSAAKKEGEVQIYINAPSNARVALSEAFNKKFGLQLVVMLGAGAELLSKITSEYRAGINQVDVFMPGASSIINAKAQGIISRIEPMLILPEVRDPAIWFTGKLPLYDKEGKAIAYQALKVPPIFYNADLVKEGEITSHLDLLKPQWKGKTVMYDPSIPGAALAGLYYLTMEWGGNEKAYEYIRSLIKENDAIVTRDMRQQVEWVARGKYLFALWPQPPAVSQHLQAGVPLAAASVKERGRIDAANGVMSVPSKPPHPNAATIFINWFLSKEGQTVASKAMGMPSARLDVPTEGVNPVFVPKPGVKYNVEDEEITLARLKFQEGFKKYFDELNR